LIGSFEKLRAAGKPLVLTGDAFRQLEKAAPSLGAALQAALGGAGQSAENFAKRLDQAPIALDRLLAATPRIASNLGTTNTTFKTLQQSTEELTAAWNNFRRVAAEETGFDIVTASIDLLTNGIQFLTEKTPALVAGWNQVKSAVAEFAQEQDAAITGRQQKWDQFFASIANGWNSVVTAAQNAITQMDAGIAERQAKWDQFFASLKSGWDDVLQKVRDVINAISQVPSPETQASFGGGMARGGLIGGSGTGTSDSNLAWVSRGEHIMPAGAVRQPGVLAFLEALRLSGGSLSRVLDQMGHFALGGLIAPKIAPVFATGGLVAGSVMHPVTIQFPGLPPIGGLRAPVDTVDELRRAAAMAQVRSGGRKPSRYS